MCWRVTSPFWFLPFQLRDVATVDLTDRFKLWSFFTIITMNNGDDDDDGVGWASWRATSLRISSRKRSTSTFTPATSYTCASLITYVRYVTLRHTSHSVRVHFPPSSRQRLRNDECPEDKREDYQNCSVLEGPCVRQLRTVIHTRTHTHTHTHTHTSST